MLFSTLATKCHKEKNGGDDLWFLSFNYFFCILESGELCCKGERGWRESTSLRMIFPSIGLVILGHDFRLFDCKEVEDDSHVSNKNLWQKLKVHPISLTKFPSFHKCVHVCAICAYTHEYIYLFLKKMKTIFHFNNFELDVSLILIFLCEKTSRLISQDKKVSCHYRLNLFSKLFSVLIAFIGHWTNPRWLSLSNVFENRFERKGKSFGWIPWYPNVCRVGVVAWD